MLATVLSRHRDAIAAAWSDRLRRLADNRYAQCDPRDVYKWSASAIDAIIRSRHGETDELRAHAREMAREREAQGFEVDEVIGGLLLLSETALPYLVETAAGSAERAAALVLELDADMRLMAGQFARLFAESKRRTVEQVAALEERQRLARDLHDLVSQSLYGVSMCAEAAARLLEAGQLPAAIERLREVRTSATEALAEMRFLIFELRPSILQDDGLVEALAARLAGVEQRIGLRTTLSAEGVGRLPPVVEEGLYGIAREALNNSLRHAHATRLEVRLQRSTDAVTLEVADNGLGFDIDAAWRRGGVGLRSMRERAERLHGFLNVASCPGEGTTIRARAPLGAPSTEASGTARREWRTS